MAILQLSLISMAALLSIAFGIRYLFTKTFMPYHATVAGQPWSELTPGLQTVILGMLRILGGGFNTYGLALLWLLLPLSRNEAWASWAALTLTLAAVLPTLYVTVYLRRFAPTAKTPIAPASIALALGVVGSCVSFYR